MIFFIIYFKKKIFFCGQSAICGIADIYSKLQNPQYFAIPQIAVALLITLLGQGFLKKMD
jgi:hypothetical protein